MFDMTQEERRVVLFMLAMVLLGLGVNFSIKVFPRAGDFTKVNADTIKIDINHASIDDLSGMLNIQRKLAKRIIEYRQDHGGFSSLEQLKEIKGLGERRWEKLSELFYVK